MQRQLAARHRVLLERQPHRLETEVGREVGDRHVLGLEGADRFGLGLFTRSKFPEPQLQNKPKSDAI